MRNRLVEGRARIEQIEAERAIRGESEFANAVIDRIVWFELIDLELQEIDEQISLICRGEGDAADRRVSALPQGGVCTKEVAVKPAHHEPLTLNQEECDVLVELLDAARTKLLVEIRRTDHRLYREELRRRLTVMEGLLERCRYL